MKKIMILGAGGNSPGIIDAIEFINNSSARPVYQIEGILDDLEENRGRRVMGYPVLGLINDAQKFSDCQFVNGISSIDSFRHIPNIIRRTQLPISRFESIIHPRATIARTAVVGNGSVILAGSVICTDATIGNHVIILQNSTVNHHSKLEDYVTLSAGITILGHVNVGKNAFIGGGSTITPRISIGESAVIGAGSVVIRNVSSGVVVAGNPAKEIKHSRYSQTAAS